MAQATLRRWVDRLFRRRSSTVRTASNPPQLKSRLRLEWLEGRDVPSTTIPLNGLTWTQMGPQAIGNGEAPGQAAATGRFDSVAVDPLDSNVLYAASANAGIWRSIDSGVNWTPLTDQVERRDIPQAQTARPVNSATVVKVVHTAINQPARVYAASSLGADGFLYVITDDRVNNTISYSRSGPTAIASPVAGLSQFNARTINEFIVVPGGGDFNVAAGRNDDLIYAAVTGTAAATPSGIYRSRDGGRTAAGWVNITGSGLPFTVGTQGFTDVDVDPTNKSVVYATVSAPTTVVGVYRVTDGFTRTAAAGANWQLRLGGAAAFSGTLPNRLVTAVSPVLSNVLFVAAADSATGSAFAIYRSTDTGLNWTPFLTTAFSPFATVPDFTGGQAGTYMNLVIDPTSPANPFQQRIFAAGFGDSANNIVFNATSAGGNLASWSDISVQGGVGPYSGVRSMVLDSQGRLLVATEGGIYRRFNNGGNFEWQSRNGAGAGALNSTQVARFGLALHPTNKNVAIINDGPLHTAALSTGDHVWQTVDSNFTAPFHQIGTNDPGIGEVLYDFNTPGDAPGDLGLVWRVAQDSATTQTIRLSTDGGLNWFDILPGIPLGSPVIMNPSDSRSLLIGVDDVYVLSFDALGNLTLNSLSTLNNVVFPAQLSNVPATVTSLNMSRQNGLVYASTTAVQYEWEGNQPNSQLPIAPFAPRNRLYVLDTSLGFGGGDWVEVQLPTAISGNTAGTIAPVNISQIIVDPNNRFNLYLTTANGQVWRQNATLAIRVNNAASGPVVNWVAPNAPVPNVLPDPNPLGPGGANTPPFGDSFPPPPNFASINSAWVQLNAAAGNTLPTANMPNATGANVIALDPAQAFNVADDVLYMGTNNGVYKLSNPGSAAPFVWTRVGNVDGNDLPNRAVTALSINTTTGILAAGLNGRGVYEIQIRTEISGNVFNDLNGNALEGAGELGLGNWVVNLRDISDPLNTFILATTTTASAGDPFLPEGSYEFRSVPAGTYQIEIVPIDSTWINTTHLPSTSFTVGLATVVSPGDGTPEPAGAKYVPDLKAGFYQRNTISGVKFDDANGNSVKDVGELGLSNFVMYIDADNDGVRDWVDGNANNIWDAGEGEPWVVTAADGSYSFLNVLGEEFLTPEWINGSNVPANYPVNAIYYGLTAATQGVSQANYTPVFIVREDLTTNSVWSQTFPQNGGPGVEPSVGPGLAAGPGYRVDMSSGTDVLNKDFGNIRPGSISGRKFLDANSNSRFETGEPGISGLVAATAFRFYIDSNSDNILQWTDLNSNNVWDAGEGEQWTRADATGFFQFNLLPPGSYRIREDMTGITGWVQTTANPANAVLTGSNSVSGILFGNVQQANFRINNSWTGIGPQPQLNGGGWGNPSVSGKVLDIAADPTNPNRYFAVSESGGIWRTQDGGTSWKIMTDGIAGISNPFMSAAAVAASDPNTIYASAAEGFLKSTDGGVTWALLPNGPGGAVRMMVDKTDKNIIFVASGDLWRSVDGGVTWQTFSIGVNISDIQLDPTNPNVIFLGGATAAGDPQNGIYRSTDALAANPTFTLMFGGSSQVPGLSVGNIKIGMAPSQPSTLYAALATAEVGGKSFNLGTYRTNDSGINWTKLVNAPDYMVDQGTYDLAIVVSPTNPNVVFAGGDGQGPEQSVNLVVVSNDGGNTWQQGIFGTGATFGPHTDIHMMQFDQSGRLLVGSDGGMFRLNNATLANNLAPPGGGAVPNWVSLNGTNNQPGAINTIQFIGIATHPTDPSKVVGGSQDNGIGLYNGNVAWQTTLGGDAGETVWDFDSPNNVYRIAPIGSVGAAGYIAKSTDGGQTWFDATDGMQGQNAQNTLFYGPLIMDPGNSQRLFTATDKVWASITGAEPLDVNGNTIPGWSANVNINNLPATITGATVVIPDTPLTGQDPPIPIDALGIGRADPNTLYVSQGGQLFKITFRVNPQLQTTDWIDVSPPGAGSITDILLDPANANTIYALDGNSVWRSQNGGNSWVNMNGIGTGQLPFSPLSIALDPRTFNNSPDDILYVGTTEGVYGLINPQGNNFSWFRVGDLNLPVTQVNDLDLNTTTGILAAGTYGRGVWETRIRGDIRGQAFNDLNGNGVRDGGEFGMAGISVQVKDPTTLAVIASTTTDAQGFYEFSSLRNGNYLVVQSLPANLVQTTADPAQLVNFTEQSIAVSTFVGVPPLGVVVDPRLDFGNFQLAQLSGVKFEDANQNGSRDAGEVGVAGFQIFVDANNDNILQWTDGNANNKWDAGEGEKWTTSAADGTYTLTGFGPAVIRGLPAPIVPPFHIREVQQAGWLQTTVNPDVTLTSNESKTNVNFGNVRPGSIRGQVFFDVNTDGLLDPGEPGLPGWQVFLDTNANDKLDSGETVLTTDATGFFNFLGLPAGTYRVREVVQSGFFRTSPNPNDVVLTGTNSYSGIIIGNFQTRNPWIEIGPRPITNGEAPGQAPATGRFDSVAVDPTDPNVIYAGSAGGGIWRSTDGGATWSARSDTQTDLFVNTIKMFHRNNGNTVYAQANTGVYKSIDGGTTFTLYQVPGGGLTAMDAVTKVGATNDSNQDILFVTGAAGVFRSTDGGQSWVSISNAFPNGAAGKSFTDIDIEPGQATPNVVYVCVGNPDGDESNGVYRIDNAMTAGPFVAGQWTLRIGGSAFFPGVLPGVIEVSISPNAPSVLFASVAERNAPLSGISRLLGMFRSFDSGINWTGLYPNYIVPTADPNAIRNFMGTDGNYNNTIIVSPFSGTNPNQQTIVVGGYGDGANNVLVSFDSGTSWLASNDLTNGPNGVGPYVDVHGATFDSNGRLLLATEGGIYRLTTVNPGGGRAWTSLNGIPGLGSLNTVTVAPFGLATHPTDPYLAFINSGRDHTAEIFNSRLPVGYGWTTIDGRTTAPFHTGNGPGRDGTGNVIWNFANPLVMYRVVTSNGTGDNDWIRKSTDGGVTWASSAFNVPGQFPNPATYKLIMDPSNSQHLFVATDVVSVSNNGGASWGNIIQTSISSTTSIPGLPTSGANPPIQITALGVGRTSGPTTGPRIYASAGGSLFAITLPDAAPPATPASTTDWQDLGAGGAVSQILVDPNDALNIYVVVNGSEVKNWFHGTWKTLTGIGDPANPNIPPSASGANVIALDPRVAANGGDDILYLGTNSGVFKLINPSGNTNPGPYVWTKVGTSLPNEPVTALDVNTTTGLLTAGTSGRGVWQVQIRAMIAGEKYDDTNGNGVRDVGEPAVAGVVMRVYDNLTNGVIATTVTDANGIYEFRSLRAGTYRVEEVVPTDSVQTSTAPPIFTLGETDSALVSYILPGAVPASVQIVPNLAFGNFRFSTISGVKFEDRNENGTRDAGEPGLPGFTIYIDANSNNTLDWTDANSNNAWDAGEGERWLVTDANGNYTFDKLGPNAAGYVIREKQQASWTQTSTNPSPFIPVSGQVFTNVNFGNIRIGRVAGAVFNDLNGDGIRTPNEPGQGGITLQLIDTSNNSVVRTLTSASDGTYIFLSLPFGTYEVRQVLPTGWLQTLPVTPTSYIRTIDSTTPQISNLDFGDFKLFTVSGVKFEDLNGDGVRGPGENGIPGFVITVRNTGTNATVTGVSDANGNYSIPNIGPGNYVVTETQKSGWLQTSANPAGFQGISGTDLTSTNFGNFKLVSATGTVFNDANSNGVRDPGEIGLPGFVVVLDKNNDGNGPGDATVTTDASGNYSFGTIAPGNYAIRQTVRNGWTITTPPNGQYLFTAVSSTNPSGRDFGNRNRQVYATGRDAGSTPMVSVRNVSDNTEKLNFLAYTSSFRGGVRVATGYLDGTTPSIVTAPGAGGGPHIRIFDSNTGEDKSGGGFFAYGASFTGGVFIATGDINGDGFDDIITAAGAGGGPHVKVFSGVGNHALLREFYAYSPSFSGGVYVAVGDVNGDGRADIITGAGAGGGPHVRVFSGIDNSILREFYAYDAKFSKGVTVAAGDVNGDGKADIITGPGAGGGPHVRVFSGATGGVLAETFAYEPTYTGGVRVASFDYNFDGRADVITAPGASRQTTINEYTLNGANLTKTAAFNTFDPSFLGGVWVG